MVSCIRAICDNRLHVCPHLYGDELKLFWFYQNRRQASFVSEKCRSMKTTAPEIPRLRPHQLLYNVSGMRVVAVFK